MMKRTIFCVALLASFATQSCGQSSETTDSLGGDHGVVRASEEFDLSRFTDPVSWAMRNNLQFLGQYSSGEKIEVLRNEPGSVFVFADSAKGKSFTYIQSLGNTGQLPFVVDQNIANFDGLASALSIASQNATPELIHALRSRINHTRSLASGDNFRIDLGLLPGPEEDSFDDYVRRMLDDDPFTVHFFPKGNDFNTGFPVFPDVPREPGTGNPIEGLEGTQLILPERNFEIQFVDPATEGEPEDGTGVAVLGCKEARGASNAFDGIIPCGHSAVILEMDSYYKKNAHCSGVIVSPRHILTAAHCIFLEGGTVIKSFNLFAPIVETTKSETLGQVRLVSRYDIDAPDGLQHEDRFDTEFFNIPDLALFELDFRDNIHNVRVPWIFTGEDITNREMHAIGYGLNPDDRYTGLRQIVRLGAIEEHCPELWEVSAGSCNNDFEFIHSSVEGLHRTDIQVASLSGFAIEPFEVNADDGLFPDGTFLPDSCVGDSGGPIFVRDDRQAWSVAAITSRPLVPKGEVDLAEPRCTGLGSINVRLGAPEIITWLTDILVKAGCVAETNGELIKFSTCVKS